MADIELVKPHDDGDFYHGTEFRNEWLASSGAGVLHHTLTATVTETDMDITVPAITARVPDGSGGLSLVAYAGGTLTVTASDVTNPRIDIIVLNAAGAAAIRTGTATDESGDVEEAPIPPLEDDEILIARIRVEENVTSILAEKVVGRAVNVLGSADLLSYSESVDTDASSGSAHTIDLEAGAVHDLTLDDNCELTFSNPAASGRASSFTLILRQDGSGGHAITWPTSVDWPAATAPTITTDASAVDVFTFMTVDGGTTWLGFVAGQGLG